MGTLFTEHKKVDEKIISSCVNCSEQMKEKRYDDVVCRICLV